MDLDEFDICECGEKYAVWLMNGERQYGAICGRCRSWWLTGDRHQGYVVGSLRY